MLNLRTSPMAIGILTSATLSMLATARADDAQTAASLRVLGGQVTETGGVVTKIFLKDCSKLGEAEFKQIGQLKSLKALTLYGSCKGLNDATLAKMKWLETLSLDEVRLTHAGLTQLKALPNLKKLILHRADISEADIAKLRADLPSVTLEWKPLADVERKALDGFLKP